MGRGLECSEHIRNQVFTAFDADGETDQVPGYTGFGQGLLAQRCVRHGRRMADETLDTSKRLGEREVLQLLEKFPHGWLTARELETQHAAETLLLFAGDFMAVVTGKPRVKHTAHGRMPIENCRELQRILLVLA